MHTAPHAAVGSPPSSRRLQGTHVLRASDAGTHRTLGDELSARGPLPLEAAIGYALEICEAVAGAHAVGRTHGNLGLDKVFLVPGRAGPITKVAFDGPLLAREASREDVARDVRAIGTMLRSLVTGRRDEEIEGATTLPSSVAFVIARSLSQDPESAFHNVGELAQALAPYAAYAAAGQPAAPAAALALSRAGIVGAGIPLAPRQDAIPLTDEWFGPRSQRAGLYAAQPAGTRRGLAFTLVSVALVGFTLGACLFLWRSETLPRWTGTAPPEVATTTITNAAAPAALPVPPTPTEAPKSTAVELLPSAPVAPEPPTTSAAAPRPLPPKVAPATPRETPAAAELRGAAPAEATPPVAVAPAVPAATMTPAVDPDPVPSAP